MQRLLTVRAFDLNKFRPFPANFRPHRGKQILQIGRGAFGGNQALVGIEHGSEFGQLAIDHHSAIMNAVNILACHGGRAPLAQDNLAALFTVLARLDLNPGGDCFVLGLRLDCAGKLQFIAPRLAHSFEQRGHCDGARHLTAAALLEPGEQIVSADQAVVGIACGAGENGFLGGQSQLPVIGAPAASPAASIAAA